MNGMMKKVLGLSLVIASSALMADTQSLAHYSKLNDAKKAQEVELKEQSSVSTPAQKLNDVKKEQASIKKENLVVRLVAVARAKATTGWDKTKTGLKSVGAFFVSMWKTVSSWISSNYSTAKTSLVAKIAQLRKKKETTVVAPVTSVEPVTLKSVKA